MAVQVSLENVNGLERRLKVSVPAELVKKVVEKCFQKVSKTIKIDGFRPGKVPARVIEERFGDSIRYQEALPQLIDETLPEAFKKAGVEPVGQPMLDGKVELVTNEPLHYAVLFDVLPEVTVKLLKGIQVEQIVSEVTDADLDAALERIRKEHTKEGEEAPALDDEFAKKFGEAKDLEEYKANIRKSMQYYIKMALSNVNKLALFDALVAENSFELPKAMIRMEIERMARGFLQATFRTQKVSQKDLQQSMPFLSKIYAKAAEKRVRLGLIFEEFMKQHPQTITDEMIQAELEERAALYQDPKAWIEEFLANPRNKEEVRNALTEIAVADELRKEAKIKEERLDYFAVLEKEKALQYRDMDLEAGMAPQAEHVHDENCGHDHHHDHEHHHHDHVAHEEESKDESK